MSLDSITILRDMLGYAKFPESIIRKPVPMLHIDLRPETAQCLAQLAALTKVSEEDMARDLIESSAEELADALLATRRVLQNNPTLSLAEMRQRLGLDDPL